MFRQLRIVTFVLCIALLSIVRAHGQDAIGSWQTSTLRADDGRPATIRYRFYENYLGSVSSLGVEIINLCPYRAFITLQNFQYTNYERGRSRVTTGDGYLQPNASTRISIANVYRGTNYTWTWKVSALGGNAANGNTQSRDEQGNWESWSSTKQITLARGVVASFQYRLRWDRVSGLSRPVIEIYNRGTASIRFQLKDIKDNANRLISAWSNPTAFIAQGQSATIILPSTSASSIKWSWSLTSSSASAVSANGTQRVNSVGAYGDWQGPVGWSYNASTNISFYYRLRRDTVNGKDQWVIQYYNASNSAYKIGFNNVTTSQGAVIQNRATLSPRLAPGYYVELKLPAVAPGTQFNWQWWAGT